VVARAAHQAHALNTAALKRPRIISQANEIIRAPINEGGEVLSGPASSGVAEKAQPRPESDSMGGGVAFSEPQAKCGTRGFVFELESGVFEPSDVNPVV
jgi:hypothetical protein